MLCSIVGCTNDKLHSGFYRFPKDEQLCDLWIDLSQRRDGLNVLNARVCSQHFSADDFRLGGSRKYINSGAVPTLFLPAANNNHPFVIAARKRILEVGSPEMEEPVSIQHEEQPFFTDHDYNFDNKIPRLTQSDPKFSKEKAIKPFTECFVDLKRICRFCLNECDTSREADTVSIAWDAWKHSKLSQFYEEITKVELIISAKCSELCCKSCSSLLRDTYKSIQMFREADEFWKLHLNTKQQAIDEIVDTEPIEEVKIEMPDYENDAYPADYLEYNTEGGIVVEEPVFDNEVIVKLEINDEEWNNDGKDNENYQKSNLCIKENRKPMAKKLKSAKRSVYNCDDEFLEGKTSCDMNSPTSTFRPCTGKSVSDEGIPIFDCDMCDKVYTTERGLNAHKQAKHNAIEAYCKICCTSLVTAIKLQKHMKEAHGVQLHSYDCEICGKILKSQSNLTLHKRIHKRSLNTVASCDQCGKVFRDQHLLRVHKRQIHGPYVPHMCPECGKVLRNKARLLVHMLVHNPVKPICEHCQKTFSSKKTIIEHMKVVHKQGAVHICEQCGRQFRNTSAGRKHSQNCKSNRNRRSIYDNGPKWRSNSSTACRFCSKSYTTLHALKDHCLKQHDPSELELLCMKCNVLLNSYETLADHKRIAHENLRCTVCKKDCLTETSLAIHMEGHANGKQRFECEICGGSYARAEYLKMHHRRVHTSERPFECTEPNCGMLFADKSDLQLHFRCRHAPVTDRPYACDICQKRFTIASILRRHMTQHTGIGAVKCDECGETFRYKMYLDTHVLSVHRNPKLMC